MFCICIHNELLTKVKELNYIPVGLGGDKFDKEWIRDNSGENISHKNKFYGEYSFHYWFWKNKLSRINDNEWIGFCAYRRFWSNQKNINNENKDFKRNVLKTVSEIWNSYDVILGDKIYVDNIKWSKILKYGKLQFRILNLLFKNIVI